MGRRAWALECVLKGRLRREANSFHEMEKDHNGFHIQKSENFRFLRHFWRLGATLQWTKLLCLASLCTMNTFSELAAGIRSSWLCRYSLAGGGTAAAAEAGVGEEPSLVFDGDGVSDWTVFSAPAFSRRDMRLPCSCKWKPRSTECFICMFASRASSCLPSLHLLPPPGSQTDCFPFPPLSPLYRGRRRRRRRRRR